MQAPIALTELWLETPLFDESIAFYTAAFGLYERERTDNIARLGTGATSEPCLVLSKADVRGLRQISFSMKDRSALAAAHERAVASGTEIAGQDTDALLLRAPGGIVIRLAVGVDISRTALEPHDRPLFMSHLVLNARDPFGLIAFYRDVIGLQISDSYERDLLTFLRCDQPQHHCVGISPGDVDGLNHFAMDCGSIDALMRSVSRMREKGYEPVWGPGRHGPGGNVFCYFEDPTGFVPEFTCDVLQIEDPASWTPKIWARTPENGNVWLSGGPTPRAVELMSGQTNEARTRVE